MSLTYHDSCRYFFAHKLMVWLPETELQSQYTEWSSSFSFLFKCTNTRLWNSLRCHTSSWLLLCNSELWFIVQNALWLFLSSCKVQVEFVSPETSGSTEHLHSDCPPSLCRCFECCWLKIFLLFRKMMVSLLLLPFSQSTNRLGGTCRSGNPANGWASCWGWVCFFFWAVNVK